jgi:predicted TIM-barrel fold metal-dependent hydrolase
VVPAGAWDCHAHVIEDPRRFPLAGGRAYEPPLAPLTSYLAMLDRYGFANGVLVQPSVYGFDNRCLLDALDRAGGRLFGIAVPSPDSSPRDLEAMHRRGVRGVRCNLLYAGGLSLGVAQTWLPVLRALQWHIDVHARIDELHLPSMLARFDVPIVIDHMGRSLRSSQLLEAVRRRSCYVKLSAPYRMSAGAAPWRDVAPFARALSEANPEACLWASDWPHTDTEAPFTMEDLIAALAEWCPAEEPRRVMLTQAGTLFPAV